MFLCFKNKIHGVVSSSCPKDCRCPADVPRCAAGVSLILDSCGCCEVCARQLNEDCSQTEPCDQMKGLECNFGGGRGSAKGICRARSDGRTCEYNKKIYQNGETFYPNCKHQCTCMDSAVGCVSLCPHELTLPKVGCASPRLIKIPGQCCEQLVCPDEPKTGPSVLKEHRKKHNKGRATEKHLTSKRGVAESLPAFRSDPIDRMLGVDCGPRTTAWSPCSSSCGPGVSTRTTSSKNNCEMVTETRVCEVRPCNQMTSPRLKNKQKCNHIEKHPHPVKLTHEGCRSLRKFQPRYCGTCSDGRCCTPHRTHTVPVLFRCKHGQTISRMVMMIKSCKCDFNCTGNEHKTPALQKLFNDIHKLKN
uniref:CCN family member 1 n=1 Tax=Sphaeramia orbicularis TaxID=375764 RepID=A0A672YE40_9TELE